jgi:hypothetical protein
MGKINSKIRTIIRSGSRYKWIRVSVLLIFPTLESRCSSFVSTTWPNDLTSLIVNLPHSWRSL